MPPVVYIEMVTVIRKISIGEVGSYLPSSYDILCPGPYDVPAAKPYQYR